MERRLDAFAPHLAQPRIYWQALSESRMTYDEFIAEPANPLTWYDLLPGDGIEVSGIPDPRTSKELAEALQASPAASSATLLDLLSARLLGEAQDIADAPGWRRLAEQLSQVMASQLTQSGDRSLRMRSQRLNYYIQALIDRTHSPEDASLVISETELQGSKPWDFIHWNGACWWLTSGDTNIHRQTPATEEAWSCGLPTQLDPLPDGLLAIGSIYTPGASITDGASWRALTHPLPVPLVFDHNGILHFVDHSGDIWRDAPRTRIGDVPCGQVHFARHIDGVVYCLDNADFGHVTTFDMTNRKSVRHAVAPVQVCNDIAVANDHIYMIDKQQGSVFKFDRDFRFMRRALRFGRGPGCLLDPVALRHQEGRLSVVSWLSGRLTTLHPF